MEIVRTTYRYAAAGGRDETRETQRSGETQAKGKEEFPDIESASPNPARGELESASLHKSSVANLPEMGKPATCRARNGKEVPGGTGRSERRERVLKDMSETWETRSCGRAGSASQNRECITCGGARRESDGLIVARKRCNARGAKEPYCMQATHL
jgi:hypothetical protein